MNPSIGIRQGTAHLVKTEHILHDFLFQTAAEKIIHGAWNWSRSASNIDRKFLQTTVLGILCFLIQFIWFDLIVSPTYFECMEFLNAPMSWLNPAIQCESNNSACSFSRALLALIASKFHIPLYFYSENAYKWQPLVISSISQVAPASWHPLPEFALKWHVQYLILEVLSFLIQFATLKKESNQKNLQGNKVLQN